ncbi:MAG: PDDEXK nuclease domain-containing protein [bacterium]
MKKVMNRKNIFNDLNRLIEATKQKLLITVNAEINLLYWQIGKRLKEEILFKEKPEYGKSLVETLSKQLTERHGRGYSKTNLFNWLKLYEVFPEENIFHAVRGKLTWTHLRILIYIKENLKREFYIEMCKFEHWSSRQLEERIGSMLFERTAISKKPEETIRQDLKLLKDEQKLSPDLVFRDPYFLDFLGLKDTYSEKDLESAIISELQRFIIEIGSDFAFMARQKRITIDNEDYRIDLLFYHRKLKCLVVIDLKLDKFKASYKGQMELYLRWLEKYESVEGENSPIGLILCTDANKEHIELLRLKESNIKVATYYTALPPMELLQEKFHQAVKIARERFENKVS